MSDLTTDPNDPRLGHGGGGTGMNAAYLILSEEERAKGFVRPLRRAYRHVGHPGPQYPLRDLTEEEQEHYAAYHYVKYEEYPQHAVEHDPATECPGCGPHGSVVGSFWTQARLDKVGRGCGVETRMGLELCETYARNPSFYGATFCVGCNTHLPVDEFVWVEDGQRVGS